MNKKFNYIIVCTLLPTYIVFYLIYKLSNIGEKLNIEHSSNYLLKNSTTIHNNSSYNSKQEKDNINSRLDDISYSVKNFGAKGNYNGTTGTDDSEAIIKAINSLKTVPNATLLFPSSSGYCVKQPIFIPSGINIKMDAPLIYLGNDNSTCLTIGEKSKTNSNTKLSLNVKRHKTSDWSDENCIGIKIINANQCDISIINSNGFTIGTQFIGDSKGFAYNTINLYSIINNKIGIDLTNNNSGWCNENLFLNGRFSCNSINSGIERYGIRITRKDINTNNGNVFIKPCFELSQKYAFPKEAIPILIEHGQTNKFICIRSEGNSLTLSCILNNSAENYIEALYGLGNLIDDKSTHPTTIFSEARTGVYRQNARIVYYVPNMSQIATPYKAGDYTHLQNLVTKEFNQTNDYKVYKGIKYNDNYIEFTRSVGIGVYVDTRQVKEFIISGQIEEGSTEPYAFVVCYDENNNIITSSNISSTIYAPGQFQNYFGGCWLSTSTQRRYFKVSEKVKKIFVGYQGNFTTPVKLKSFMLETTNIDYVPSIILPINKESKHLAIEPPKIGTWEKATIIYNDNPIELGENGKKFIIQGWICEVGGSPGTWKEIRSLTGN